MAKFFKKNRDLVVYPDKEVIDVPHTTEDCIKHCSQLEPETQQYLISIYVKMKKIAKKSVIP